MTDERAKELGKVLADFYLERPMSEARQVLQEAFRQLQTKTWCHDCAQLLREHAEFLESSADWTPDRFHHWRQPTTPFTAD
jgi:hypothetical protein